MCPEVGVNSPKISFIKVDLPAPLGPMTLIFSPRSILRLILLSSTFCAGSSASVKDLALAERAPLSQPESLPLAGSETPSCLSKPRPLMLKPTLSKCINTEVDSEALTSAASFVIFIPALGITLALGGLGSFIRLIDYPCTTASARLGEQVWHNPLSSITLCLTSKPACCFT